MGYVAESNENTLIEATANDIGLINSQSVKVIDIVVSSTAWIILSMVKAVF